MLLPASLLLAGVALPLPLAAQGMVQPLPGTTDADKLADLVRRLGRSPRDLSALIEAGELSAKLGDTTAAAALFKRASQVDPNNARVKAGVARILVNGEHPGEALRYFEQAERAGLAPAAYAGDRGLAYDLIGEQERAQRDYRLALARPGQDDEDEVRRRYALSLGISGRKDEALQQIDALLRRSDRGAWRARAFILAMNGDASGANRIATTMMPAGMGTGLAAFFTRLPTLSPADRAFAVHFGEVTPTPERIADARLVPALPALAPDPYARTAPVQVAAQTASPTPVARDRRRGRDQRQVAQRAAPVSATAQSMAAPAQVAQVSPAATAAYPRATPPTTASSNSVPAQLALASPSATATRPTAPTSIAAPTPTQVVQASPSPTTSDASTAATTGTVPAFPAATANLAYAASSPQPTAVGAAAAPTQPLVATNLATAAESRTIVPEPGTSASSTASANNLVRVQSADTSAAQPPAQVAAAPATPPRSEGADTILARIVANISIPASELGVAPMPGAAPQPGTTSTLDEAAIAAERNAAAAAHHRTDVAAMQPAPRPATRTRRTPVQTSAEDTAPVARRRGAATEAPVEESPAATKSRRRGAAREQVAAVEEDAPVTRRGARGKKATDIDVAATDTKKSPAKSKAKADAKVLADRKAAADEKKAARTEPERYWIQVAGGATQGDLKKAWTSAKAKSSLLAGRAGYSTPLRATNRVVTGPFKTQAEAQAMVNKLSKQGVSAFTFTSEAGQKMTKLDGK